MSEIKKRRKRGKTEKGKLGKREKRIKVVQERKREREWTNALEEMEGMNE